MVALEDTLALTVTVPETVESADGCVMLTLGGVDVDDEVDTVTPMGAEVELWPVSVVAIAVRVCDPAEVLAVFQETW